MFTQFDSELYSAIRGALLVVFLYHIIIYFQNRRKLYLYFSLYSLLLFIFFLRSLLVDDISTGVFSYLNYPLQYVTFATYIVFSRELLQTNVFLVKWDKWLSLAIKVLLVLSLTFVVINLVIDFKTQQAIYYYSLPFLFAFNFISYIKFFKIKGSHVRLFIGFSTIFYSLLIITYAGFFISGFKQFLESIKIDPMVFFFVGGVLKIVMIAAIIGFRIKELEENRIISEMELSKQIAETSELKMTALQSQMNPHFLFNSLNSINNFIIKSQVEKASDYITKFSKLIREILKNSSKNTISLAEELSNLKIYVLLENIRIDGGFAYNVEIDSSINPEIIKVPPLFLQPYVENAIWHGLTHIEGDKKIDLLISKSNELIKFEIIDNGIGYDRTKEQAEIKRDERVGFATKATDVRIRTLFKDKDTFINIEDISTKNVTGTKVTLMFPIVKMN
ncbi:MAG: histidine kinase [Flavobacteriaceae bacterium]|nr:histidine kinase [Flavobacteriaceae bacterium]